MTAGQVAMTGPVPPELAAAAHVGRCRAGVMWLVRGAAHIAARSTVGLALITSLAEVGSATTAADLCEPEADPCNIATSEELTDGSLLDFGQRSLTILAGGRLDAGSGSVTVLADSFTIEAGGELRALGDGTVRGGTIRVTARSIAVAGSVQADGSRGGLINLLAEEDLSISGDLTAAAVTADGAGGNLLLSGNTVEVNGSLFATGGRGGFGGSIRVEASAKLTTGGRIDAGGGEGGDITLIGADLDLKTGSRVATDSNGTGGNGGSITLAAGGRGPDSSGNIAMEGSLSADGANGVDFGGDGGDIAVTAAGDIVSLTALSRYQTNSGTPDGFGGTISLSSSATIDLHSLVSARGRGERSLGGDIDINADGSLAVRGTISAAGSDGGGTLALSIVSGSMTVGPEATLSASGTRGGSGGEITMTASATGATALIRGAVFSDGGSAGPTESAGTGGDIQIRTDGGMTVTGRVEALGGSGNGVGGDISLTTDRGVLRLDGNASARAFGPSSEGGSVTLESGLGLVLTGRADAAGGLLGGKVQLSTSGTATLQGTVDVSGASAGSVDAFVDGDVTVTGIIKADGAAEGALTGGTITVDGCAMSIAPDATLSALGDAGTNRLVGRNSLVVEGNLAAGSSNELVYGPTSDPPEVRAGAVIEGQLVQTLSPMIAPCGECPNGDANGDQEVTAGDLAALLAEIFDGDGEAAGLVEGGTFPGCSGADANRDGRITAADTVKLEILLPSSPRSAGTR